MKKIIGYGYRLSDESLKEALKNYDFVFASNKEDLLEEIKLDQNHGGVSKKAKPKIFRVIVEEV